MWLMLLFCVGTLSTSDLLRQHCDRAQKKTSVENASIIMVLEPVWTVFLSILWYGEEMPFQKIMGCMLILFSLFLYRGWDKLHVAFLVDR